MQFLQAVIKTYHRSCDKDDGAKVMIIMMIMVIMPQPAMIRSLKNIYRFKGGAARCEFTSFSPFSRHFSAVAFVCISSQSTFLFRGLFFPYFFFLFCISPVWEKTEKTTI